MSDIRIRRSHRLDHDHALRVTREVAAHLAEAHDVNTHWEGDSLHFDRSGVHGRIDVEPAAIVIEARLGLLLKPMKGRFEAEIHRYLDQALANA